VALTFAATAFSFLLSAWLPRPITMLATILWVVGSYSCGVESLWSSTRWVEALLFPFTPNTVMTDAAPIGPSSVPAWIAGGLFGAGVGATLAAAQVDSLPSLE
jgi:hypothetical protein